MSDTQTIQVNFGRPMPVFPLDSVTLLPQQVLPLHIFEPRYRQMVSDVLDGAGQIAMAVFRGDAWKTEYHGNPPLRPAVCVGQVVRHEKLPDGRYNILLQGVCRARLVQEHLPSEERMYRAATLVPVGLSSDEAMSDLDQARKRLADRLGDGPLSKLTAASSVAEYADDEDVPSAAIFELAAFTMIEDSEVRYRLLAEADPVARARVVQLELDGLERLIRLAQRQHPEDWPKGCSWN